MLKYHKKRRKSGVTLLELTIVISIIVLVTAFSVPNISAMMKTHRVNSAKTMIRTFIGRAQAHAQLTGRLAGVRFQFDRDGWEDGRQYMVLIEKPVGVFTAEFNAVADERPIALPEGIGVISTVSDDLDNDFDNYYQTDNSGIHDATTFSFVFAPSGRLVFRLVRLKSRNVLGPNFDQVMNIEINVDQSGRPNNITNIPVNSGLLYDDGDHQVSGNWVEPVPWCRPEPSTGGFIIYEVEKMKSIDSPLLRYEQYVERDLNELLVNAYTGEIIESED